MNITQKIFSFFNSKKEIQDEISLLQSMKREAENNAQKRMIEILERNCKEARMLEAKKTPKSESKVQLPIWPDPVRAVPNGVLRSALFGAIRRGRRRVLDQENLASVDGVEIKYTGYRLDQGDLDVWESVLHVSRLQEMGKECRFTAYQMLKHLGFNNSGANIKTLHSRLIRLGANMTEIKQGGYIYAGSLINDIYKEEKTKEYVIVINPKLRPLFEADQFTQVDWEVRQALCGHQLAQWLHGFYASHAEPYPVKIETLLKLSGSETEQVHDFYPKLRKALDAVVLASAKHGQGFNYSISDGLVYVVKKGTKSQQRHLVKKETKALKNTRMSGLKKIEI